MDSLSKYVFTLVIAGFASIYFFGTFFGVIAIFFLSIFFWNIYFPNGAASSKGEVDYEEKSSPSFIDKTLWNGSRKVQIEYTNAAGEFTDRKINLRSVNANKHGEIYIRAFCELRGEMRTFRADRVEKITDAKKHSYPDFFEYMSQVLGI